MPDRPLTLGSLFSGIGAFELAGSRHGFTPLWASEIEPFPIRVSKHHFPHMRHLGSVTEVRGDEIEPVDVVTFGSPCQDISQAGRRNGMTEGSGTRSSLFFEAIRIIKEMREATDGRYPRYALWENVPSALTSAGGHDFAAVLRSLADIGAVAIGYRILDAQGFGVAQRRRRIFLIADFERESCSALLFVEPRLRRHNPPGRQARADATSPSAAGAGSGRGAGSTLEVASTITASAGHHGRSSPRGDGTDNLVPVVGGTPTVAGPMMGNSGTSAEHGYAFGQQGWESGYAVPVRPGPSGPLSGDGNRRRLPEGYPVVAGTLGATDGGWASDVERMTFLPDRIPVGTVENPEVAHCLAAGAGGEKFGSGRDGQDTFVVEPIALNWQSGGSKDHLGISSDATSALSTNQTPAIAFQERGREGGRTLEYQEDLAYCLTAPAGGGRRHEMNVAAPMAFSCKDHGADADEVAPTLRAMGHDGSHANGGGQVAVVRPGDPRPAEWRTLKAPEWGVRRLMPEECEKLMGLPPGWTDVPDEKGKPASDSNRYKAIGNSIAIPCLEFIFANMQRVLTEERAADEALEAELELEVA